MKSPAPIIMALQSKAAEGIRARKQFTKLYWLWLINQKHFRGIGLRMQGTSLGSRVCGLGFIKLLIGRHTTETAFYLLLTWKLRLYVKQHSI